MKNVILMVKDKPLVVRLFNLDETAHGKIDDGRCNIARMNAIIQQSPRLRWRNPRWRFIHRRYGHSRIRIAPRVPPQHEHHNERHGREKYRRIAADEPE